MADPKTGAPGTPPPAAAGGQLPPFPDSTELEGSLKPAVEAKHPLLGWARQINRALQSINELIRVLAQDGPPTGELRKMYDAVNGKSGGAGDEGKSLREVLIASVPSSDPLKPKTVAELIALIERVVAAADAKAQLASTPADEKDALGATKELLSAFESVLKPLPTNDPAPAEFRDEVLRQVRVRQLQIQSSN